MRMRGLDIPADVVSARVNATQEVIDDYSDERTPRERMEQRREKLDDLESCRLVDPVDVGFISYPPSPI